MLSVLSFFFMKRFFEKMKLFKSRVRLIVRSEGKEEAA